MGEKTLNLPLSGEEVLEALTQQIRSHLRRDCFLGPTTAYQFFEAKITLAVKLHDVGRIAEVNTEVVSKIGQPPENPDEFLEQFDSEFEIPKAPPNEVREETEQPIPTLATEKGKPEIKKVKYAKKGKQ